MFERPRHQLIEILLRSLDAATLRQHQCWFGGGTAIALRYGEFRESRDVGFLVSDLDGFRALRRRVGDAGGVAGFSRPEPGGLVQADRDMRSDRYGIRTCLRVLGEAIKLEIVFEARIQLDAPTPSDRICDVDALTPADMVASKLLANVDRWADGGVFARDVIDLAMMDPPAEVRERGLAKACSAYGADVLRDLARAVERLEQRPGWLGECADALQLRLPPAAIWQRVRALKHWY